MDTPGDVNAVVRFAAIMPAALQNYLVEENPGVKPYPIEDCYQQHSRNIEVGGDAVRSRDMIAARHASDRSVVGLTAPPGSNMHRLSEVNPDRFEYILAKGDVLRHKLFGDAVEHQ